MFGGAGCSALDLGQVGRQVVGEPAAAGPEGLGLRRLGVPVMVGSPVAGVLGCLTTYWVRSSSGLLAGVWAERSKPAVLQLYAV